MRRCLRKSRKRLERLIVCGGPILATRRSGLDQKAGTGLFVYRGVIVRSRSEFQKDLSDFGSAITMNTSAF